MLNSSWDFVALVDQIMNKAGQIGVMHRKRNIPLPVWEIMEPLNTVEKLIDRFNKHQFAHDKKDEQHVLRVAEWMIHQSAQLNGGDGEAAFTRWMGTLDMRHWSQKEPISRDEAKRTRFQRDEQTGAMFGWQKKTS